MNLSTGSVLVKVAVDKRPLVNTAKETLEHVHVQTHAFLPPFAWLRFHSPDPAMLSDNGIDFGSVVSLSVDTHPLFTGEVTAMQSEVDGTGTHLVVTAHHRAHRLCRNRAVAAYAGMTLEQVVNDLAKQSGVEVGTVTHGKRHYPHLTQAAVSDWTFLDRLAREQGTRLGIDPDGKLSIHPPAGDGTDEPHRLKRKTDTLTSARATVNGADQPGMVEVRGWDLDTKRELKASAQARRGDRIGLGATPGHAADELGAKSVEVTATGASGQSDVQQEADSLAASVADGFAELEVVTEFIPRLLAGKPVQLESFGWPFDGRYTPTVVEHNVGRGGSATRLWFNAFEADADLVSSGGLAPGRLPGLAIALVTNVDHPQQKDRGWVKLKFPWLSEKYESDWVRTVQHGGLSGGGLVLPDVGDEVLVGFEHGRLDRPYVIGGLYNGQDKPSAGDSGALVSSEGKVQRHWVSNRHGDRLELSSAASGPSGVLLETGDGLLSVRLDRDQSCVTVTADGKASVTVSGKSGAVDITAQQSVTVQGNGITLDAGQGQLSIKASTVTIGAQSVDIT